MITTIPMIAGEPVLDELSARRALRSRGQLGDLHSDLGWDQPADTLGWLERDLSVTESLVNFQAITVGQIRQMLMERQQYIATIPVTDEGARRGFVAAISAEIDKLARYSQDGPAPADLWPGERRAVEQAYQWADGDGAALELDADKAQARADTLNKLLGTAGGAAGSFGAGLEKTLQDAVKWLAIGALAIGAIMVLPQLMGGVSQLMKDRR